MLQDAAAFSEGTGCAHLRTGHVGATAMSGFYNHSMISCGEMVFLLQHHARPVANPRRDRSGDKHVAKA